MADSIDYYESCGFKHIESPWTITKEIANITKPKGCNDFTVKEKNKVLVASGEQSFLYLYNKGFLPKGKYQTITPCFRDESFDVYHTKYFIKNELMITDNVCIDELNRVVECARDFFRKYCLLPKKNDYYVSSDVDDVLIKPWPNTNKAFDLEYRGIELGSYGIRKCEFLEWIFGTGVAEPRLSRVMETYGISQS